MASVKIKKEKTSSRPATAEEKELEEWAKKLAARPAPQIGAGGAAQNFLSQAPTDIVPANSGFDMDSAIGRFTWHSVESKKDNNNIPCLYRNGEKYCCVRMAETSIMGELLNNLPQEIYDAASLDSHFVTPAEAKLLTYINQWHCEQHYGPETFTVKDLVVSLDDLMKFYSYLSFAYNVLQSGGQNKDDDFSKCGFVRVNSDSLIPYTVLSEDEKGVPLFYFEGQTDILKEKAQPLKGWELAYLKVCCKVQGVRKDLITGPTLQIVKLSDLKAYFPKRAVFTENCWPPAKSKSLLPKQAANGVLPSSNKNVSTDKWTKNIPNENFANYKTTVNTATTATPTNSTGLVVAKVGASNTSVVNSVTIPQLISKLDLVKMKATGPPVDHARLTSVPEYVDGSREGAYVVRLIMIEKEFVHCINMKPHSQDKYLVVLPEFMSRFFPTVSIYPTAVTVLKNIGLATYVPNNAQIRILNTYGFSIQKPWEMPLILAAEAAASMPKLRHFFRAQYSSSRNNPMQNIVNNRSTNNGYNRF